MRFTLRQLEYAVAVARHLNFSKAAATCHVSQPSLSSQLKELENAIGMPLFERTSRRVEITAFGEEFVRQATVVLTEASALEDLVLGGKEPLSGRLVLGVIPTVAPYLLPRFLPALHARHPDCRVILREDTTERLTHDLDEGRLDVLLLATDVVPGNHAEARVFDDALVVALPTGHPLAAEEGPLRIEDLPPDELLLLEDGHCLSDQVKAVCGFATAEMGDFRAASLGTLVQMVAGGAGLTLVPAMAVESEVYSREGVVVRRLVERATRAIGFVWRRNSPRESEFQLLAELLDATVGRTVAAANVKYAGAD